MQLANAVQKIVQGRQQVLVVWIASSRPQGVVVANSTAGSRVRLQVSAGAKPAQPTSVPDVTGESQAQATSDLQAAGFTVITAQWPVSDSSADGMVVAETPAGGGNAPQGAAIVLYIGTASGG
jgi:serine/threonine-protein kinase